MALVELLLGISEALVQFLAKGYKAIKVVTKRKTDFSIKAEGMFELMSSLLSSSCFIICHLEKKSPFVLFCFVFLF